jgi:hypothetical protein
MHAERSRWRAEAGAGEGGTGGALARHSDMLCAPSSRCNTGDAARTLSQYDITADGSATLAKEAFVVVIMNLVLDSSPQGAGLLLRMAFQSASFVTPWT